MLSEKYRTIFSVNGDILFFILVVIYQIAFIFQGLDLSDEGFYAVVYQQIFNDPQSVAFNFMYWLTGILGGAWFYVFPHTGLLGFRILGVLVTTATLIITYNALKNYIPKVNLRIGLAMVLLFMSNDPKEMYYNNLSALLYVFSAILLFNGLFRRQYAKILFSGAMISLSMFSRMPSASGLVFVVAIIYYTVISKTDVKQLIKQVVWFTLGFLFTTAVILLIMKMIGHWKIFADNLSIAWGMGFDSDGANNIFKLLKLFIKSYSVSIVFGLAIIVSAYILLSVFEWRFFRKLRTRRLWIIMLWGSSILLLGWLLLFKELTYGKFQMIITGICLLSAFAILVLDDHKERKLLAILGVLILLFHPFGSEHGLLTVGRYSLWIILPMTQNFFNNIEPPVQFKIVIDRKNLEKIFVFRIGSGENLKVIKSYFLMLFTLTSLYFAYNYPFCDINDRCKMDVQVNNPLVKGIYTTDERARAINELLDETKKYVKKNDVLFAYDNIPMIHFLTSTKPFLRNPWPGYYYSEAFQIELNLALNKTEKLPLVITEKINKIGQKGIKDSAIQISWSPIDYTRDSIFNNFIKIHNYQRVWENKAFEILIPGDKINNNN